MKFQFRIWHTLIVVLLAALVTIYLRDRHFQSKLDTKIEQLDLSLRATNCLIYARVETVEELIEKDESQLLSIRNMGETTVVEIRNKLESMGLKLKQAPESHHHLGP